MEYFRFFTQLSVCLLLTTLECTYAQSLEDSTSMSLQLNELVVFGSPLMKEVIPVQKLSGDKLKNLSSFSVADAIRYFSGVQLKDYGGVGGIKTINVRSLGSAHTAVFYDGMTVGNAQNAQVDLSKYSLDNIEAIELYNGQKSSIFQPARGFFASNSLYLRSKTPRFEKDEQRHIRASFKTGSFGL